MREKFFKISDYAAEFSLYGLLVFLPISNAAIESFFGFLFLFFLFKKVIKPDFKFLMSSSNIFLFFFALFISLSLFNSGPYFVKSLKALFFKWLEYIFIFIIAQDTLYNRKRIRNCLIILLSVSVLIAIDAFYQRFFYTDFLRHNPLIPQNTGRLTASFEHYNDFGTYLIVILSLIISSLFVSKQKKTFKFSLFLLIIILTWSLMLTFSRGSWLSFIFTLILMSILFLRLKNKLIFCILICFLSSFIFVLTAVPALKNRAVFTISSLGDADRFIVWQYAFKMIKSHPILGTGVGTFMDHFYNYSQIFYEYNLPKRIFVQYAHNCYLQIWAETGIFSLLSFLFFIGSILYSGIKSFCFSEKHNFALLGFVCGFFGYLVHSFFDTPLYSLQLAVLFWFMAGVICAITKLEKGIPYGKDGY